MQHDPVKEQDRLRREYENTTDKRRVAGDGVVTTPVEIVDFINRAAAEVIREKWGITLDDARVFIEDPFAGTGIFGARLIDTVPDNQVQGVVDKLRCIEIDAAAADIAEHNIRARAYARGALPPLDRRIVQVADTFQIGEEGENQHDT